MRKFVISAVAGLTFTTGALAEHVVATVDNFHLLTMLQEAMQKAVLEEINKKLKKEWEDYSNRLVNQAYNLIRNSRSMLWNSISCKLPAFNIAEHFPARFDLSLNTPCRTYNLRFGDDIRLSYRLDTSDPDLYKELWQKQVKCEENPDEPGCTRLVNANRSPMTPYVYDDEFRKKLTFLKNNFDKQIEEFNNDVKALSTYQALSEEHPPPVDNSIQQAGHRLRLADKGLRGINRLEPIPSKEFFENMDERQKIVYSIIADKQLAQDKYIEAMYERIKAHYSTIYALRESLTTVCETAESSSSGGTDQSARLLIPVMCEKAKIEFEKAQIMLDQLEVQVLTLRAKLTDQLERLYSQLKVRKKRK